MAPADRSSTRERDFDFTLTRESGDGLTFEGYAAVFNTPARIKDQQGEYDEVIAPTAFNQAIRSGRRPLFMFNHGKHPVWADLPIGTITDMRADPNGLFVQARMLSHDFFAPLREAIAAKAIPGMSFRFDPAKGKDEWQNRSKGQVPVCTRKEVNCPELGPVISPAYVETTAALRSIVSRYEEQYPGLRDLGAVEGIAVDTDVTDPQSLVMDAVAALWGFDDRNAFNWVEMHDDYMIFGLGNNFVSDHRGLWQVNFTYDNGNLAIDDPVQVGVSPIAKVQTVPIDQTVAGPLDEPNVPVDFAPPRSALIGGVLMRAKYDTAQLEALKAKGHTFPGTTSYPIEDVDDLDSAIRAVGMGNADHDAIRRYIIGRAKAMGLTSKIPDNWNADGSMSNTNSQDLGTLKEAATSTSGEAATQVRTGPLTSAERRRQLRLIQLERRGVNTRKAS